MTNPITPSIKNLRNGFNGKATITPDEMSLIIAFINGLNDGDQTLYHLKNDSNETIIYHYEQIVRNQLGQRPGNGNEPDIELGTLGGRIDTVAENPTFFSRFHSNVTTNFWGRTRNLSLVSNVYDKASAGTYAAIAGTLGALGSVLGSAGALAANAGAKATGEQYEDIKASRYAIYGCVAGLASAGCYFLMRTLLTSNQTSDNDRFIEAAKRVAKVKIELDDFFRKARDKAATDTEKGKEKVTKIRENSFMTRSNEASDMETFLFEILARAIDIKVNIELSDLALVSVDCDGNSYDISESNFDKFYRMASVL